MSTVQYKRVYLKHGYIAGTFVVCGTDDPEVCGQALLKFNTPEETWDSSQSYKGNNEMRRIVDKEFWQIVHAVENAVASEREACLEIMKDLLREIQGTAGLSGYSATSVGCAIERIEARGDK